MPVRSSLAGDLREGHAVITGTAQHLLEPLGVGQRAFVEREHALIEVPVQVERLDADVRAMQAALERGGWDVLASRVPKMRDARLSPVGADAYSYVPKIPAPKVKDLTMPLPLPATQVSGDLRPIAPGLFRFGTSGGWVMDFRIPECWRSFGYLVLLLDNTRTVYSCDVRTRQWKARRS